MSHISRRKKNAAKIALASTGILSVPLVTNTPKASADVTANTTVYNNQGNPGVTKTSNSKNVPNDSVINQINSEIRNLQTASNGTIQIDSQPITINNDDISNVQGSINRLSDLINQYNQLKASLNAQNNTNERINGMTGIDTMHPVTGDSLDQKADNLQTIVNQMQQMSNDNQNKINQNTQDASQHSALRDDIKQANVTISNASGDLKGKQDGIYGDMDKINRKSYDSVQQDGIVVDNTDTQRINTVNTNATTQPKVTKVNTVDDVNTNLNRILNNLKNQTTNNDQEVAYAGNYRDNGLYNIDDINNWLAQERQKQVNGQNTANTETQNAQQNAQTTTTNGNNAVQKLMDELKAKGATDKVLEKVQDAIDTMSESGIEQNQLPDVGQYDPHEFGDIGQTQDTQNGAQDGTISNTKSTEDSIFTNEINSTLAQQASEDQASYQNGQNTLNDNQKNIDAFLAAVAKDNYGHPKGGSTGSSTETTNGSPMLSINHFKNWPIFKGAYASFLSDAFKETQGKVDALADKIGNGKLSTVPNGTNMATLSAALYQKKAKSLGKGFGSVMFYSNNINSLHPKIGGDNLLYRGTPEAAINFFTKKTLGSATQHYADFPIIRDMKSQYMGAPDGNARTLTVVSTNPSLTITIPRSFVYVDDKNNVSKADVSVTVRAKAYDGGSINSELSKNFPTASGTHGLYFYNFQINQYTGQLVAGTGYVAVQGKAIGSGRGGDTGGGGGESMVLDQDTTNTNQQETPNGITNNMIINNDVLHGEAMLDNSQKRWGQPIAQSAFSGHKAVGLRQEFTVNVHGAGSFASNAPLFVGDIDDGQRLIPGDNKVVAGGMVDRGGDIYSKSGSNTNASTTKSVKVTDHSAALYNMGKGLHGMNFSLSERTDPDSKGRDNYYSIDTSLFAPFGVVPNGTKKTTPDDKPQPGEIPDLNVQPINMTVDSLNINKPEAKAETKGQYNLNSNIEYLYSGQGDNEPTQNMSSKMVLPSIQGLQPSSMIASSNDSFVVIQNHDQNDRTSAGNSFILRTSDTPLLTSSGNSLILRNQDGTLYTGSGNAFVIREGDTPNQDNDNRSSFVIHDANDLNNTLAVQGTVNGWNNPTAGYNDWSNNSLFKDNSVANNDAMLAKYQPIVSNLSASGLINVENGQLVVNSLAQANNQNNVVNKIVNNTPQITTNPDGTHTVSMGVYVDPTLKSIAQSALNDWKTALETQGVHLNYNLTSNIDDLKQGEALALLASNDSDTRVDSPSGKDTLNDVAGLTTKHVYAHLTHNASNSLFNETGTITAGDALKNAGTVIQMNKQGLSDYLGMTSYNNVDTLTRDVLKHEMGHNFGLKHEDNDTLMTPDVGNLTFTGQISTEDARLAARNLLNPQKYINN